ncbi:MAG: hypothetical protein LBL69_01710 [Zoogloeaceae bacterium]|jgi:hypothetical protein|nr:hypothetical protein [Zoogloeaceae bacterium]
MMLNDTERAKKLPYLKEKGKDYLHRWWWGNFAFSIVTGVIISRITVPLGIEGALFCIMVSFIITLSGNLIFNRAFRKSLRWAFLKRHHAD